MRLAYGGRTLCLDCQRHLDSWFISSLMVSLTTSVATPQSANRMPPPPRPRAKEGKVTAVRLKTLKSGREVKCPANFSDIGAITTNGPAEVKYKWVSSDGREWPERTLKFTRNGTKDVSINWRVGKPGETVRVWLQLKVVSPNELVSNKSPFEAFCLK
jgi:hypothetical protein